MNWEYATVIFEQSAPVASAPYHVSTTALTIPGLALDRQGQQITQNVRGVIDGLSRDGWEVLFSASYSNRQHFYLKRQRGSAALRPQDAHLVRQEKLCPAMS